LNLIEELREKKLLWIGGKDSNEEKEAKNANIQFESIYTMKLATTRSPKVLLYPFVLLRGIFEARKILKYYSKNNSCVFSKG
jgi:UDP-N-acetylglucosamine:LPS N-acetylglucosamine transferase